MRLLPSQTGDYEVHFLKKEFAFRDEGFFFFVFLSLENKMFLVPVFCPAWNVACRGICKKE